MPTSIPSKGPRTSIIDTQGITLLKYQRLAEALKRLDTIRTTLNEPDNIAILQKLHKDILQVTNTGHNKELVSLSYQLWYQQRYALLELYRTALSNCCLHNTSQEVINLIQTLKKEIQAPSFWEDMYTDYSNDYLQQVRVDSLGKKKITPALLQLSMTIEDYQQHSVPQHLARLTLILSELDCLSSNDKTTLLNKAIGALNNHPKTVFFEKNKNAIANRMTIDARLKELSDRKKALESSRENIATATLATLSEPKRRRNTHKKKQQTNKRRKESAVTAKPKC